MPTPESVEIVEVSFLNDEEMMERAAEIIAKSFVRRMKERNKSNVEEKRTVEAGG